MLYNLDFFIAMVLSTFFSSFHALLLLCLALAPDVPGVLDHVYSFFFFMITQRITGRDPPLTGSTNPNAAQNFESGQPT